jgi:hypothetical protein
MMSLIMVLTWIQFVSNSYTPLHINHAHLDFTILTQMPNHLIPKQLKLKIMHTISQIKPFIILQS